MSNDKLPDFGSWSNEEIGAFIKGLGYVQDSGDVTEIMDTEVARSLLAKIGSDTSVDSEGGVATIGPPTRAQFIERISQAADQKFRKTFKGKAASVAAQISSDVHPFLEEAMDRLRDNDITLHDLNELMSKMVIVASASTIVAQQQTRNVK